MPGSSRSMSPRSRASCSSKGSPKTKRPSNGKGKCAYPLGCNKYRQNGTRFCVKHGGVRRCAMPGCPNAAKRGDTTKAMFCIRHGGGKSCRVPGCGVSARGSTGYCYKHRNLTSAISRKDSTASTASGSELDQASQLTPVGSAEEVSGGDVVDFSIDLASSYLDATCWEAQPATGECQTNLASLDFMALSDEKWTSFVEPLEPLPELLTNHINSDASDKLYLF
ncbi:hypothetical protein Pmar_PMAR012419 [Perkinsus marinus ATCC 50983]|uniref:Uncharacterized protein n=1 Tax=Perkinsus marinus (strain ATCC 50983 / TXsc) TaxID=423536 RepID=C5K7A4_PERM5|nr:hypothetical protein Pmar_PMAR012419 [Perkinsus marinus ATCC 50983]EER19439.1 hypothetical protein Pmar_PMAR012419 [Perkinsus marinus ATCC 50983]|eukprot:XP_002787643.1 hypothetical protein Pmar_PMAR012419 [Perkinsus marinus ATCC 50983]